MYRLLSSLRRITYYFQRPGDLLRFRMWSLRPTWLMRLQQQRNYLRATRGQFAGLRLPGFGKKQEDEDSGVQIGSPPPRARRRKQPGPVRQEVGQVHLVHASGKRQIVHVGSPVGYKSIEVRLSEGHGPVRLRFTQEDTGADPSVSVALVSGVDKILVDGHSIGRRSLPVSVQFDSQIEIEKQVYTCELFASGAAPAGAGLAVNCRTSAGLHYDLNQDAVGLGQHDIGSMFVIADGVNGGYAGEQVSAFVVRYLMLVFKQNIEREFSWLKILTQSIERINREVYDFGQRSPDHAGTTLTVVVIRGLMAYVAHVGDSRLYLMRQGRLRQLTNDHVTTSRIVPTGDAGEVKHPRLRKAIGKEQTIKPDVFTFSLQPNDRLLLCTDGVSDVVSNDRLTSLLVETPRVELPQELIRLANTREVPDNASAVVVDILSQPTSTPWAEKLAGERVFDAAQVFSAGLDHPPAYDTVFQKPRRRARSVTALLAVIAAAVILVFIVGGGALPAITAGSPAGDQTPALNTVPDGTGPLTVIPAVIFTPEPTLTVVRDLATATPFPTQLAAPTSTIRPSNQ